MKSFINRLDSVKRKMSSLALGFDDDWSYVRVLKGMPGFAA